eukprot:11884048-Heterocapsa_arctica.AAC.1
MHGGDRRMILAQPRLGTEVQLGEQKRAGEPHPEASVEAGRGTALGFDGTQVSVRVNDATGHGTVKAVEPRGPLLPELSP